MTLSFAHLASPLGRLVLVKSAAGLVRLQFDDDEAPDPAWRRDPAAFREETAQLEAYFSGDRDRFDLALAPRGTPFQLRVWRALAAIPFGRTSTYAEIARAIGSSKACRAVGAANRVNPFAIVVPCHRVVGASGDLTGYAGGLDRKRWLLRHERAARELTSAGTPR